MKLTIKNDSERVQFIRTELKSARYLDSSYFRVWIVCQTENSPFNIQLSVSIDTVLVGMVRE